MKWSKEAGIRLKQIRKDKGLTQEMLAEFIHYSKTSIVMWEQGKTPKSERVLIQVVEEILDTNLEWVLTGEGIKVKNSGMFTLPEGWTALPIIKRYELRSIWKKAGETIILEPVKPTEDENGAWVYYDDVKHLIK